MSETREIRLALLISGGGTTMERILHECAGDGRLSGVRPACVISNSYGAGGLAKAQSFLATTDILVVPDPGYQASEDARLTFGEQIIAACRERGVDWIGQYGWMPMTPRNVIEAFAGRMINQHPGPIRPGQLGFGGRRMFGTRVHAARLHFVRRTKRDFWTEATAQRVHPEFDEGEIIKIGRIDIRGDDTPESLQKRLLPVEHDTQVAALEDVMRGRVAPVAGLQPLVLPGEEQLLEEAKRAGWLLYP